MRLIQTTDYHELFCDDARGLYVFVRNRTKYPTPEVYVDNVVSALGQTGHRSYGMVIDSRAAIGSNDARFEDVPKKLNGLMYESVTKVAILLKTQLGVLQSQRVIAQDGSETLMTTTDVTEAYAFAASR